MNPLLMLNLVRAAGVNRWHTEGALIPAESDGQHSFMVAMLCNYIIEFCPLAMTAENHLAVLRAALYHDMGEHWVSDVSAVVKWKLDTGVLEELEAVARVDQLDLRMPELTETQQAIVKMGDFLSPILYCAQLAYVGNREGLLIVNRLLTRLDIKLDCYTTVPKELVETFFALLLMCVAVSQNADAIEHVHKVERAWQELRMQTTGK